MEFTCVRSIFRLSGFSQPYSTTDTVTSATAKATHHEPDRNEPMTATAKMMMYEPQVAFRLPPRGMYR